MKVKLTNNVKLNFFRDRIGVLIGKKGEIKQFLEGEFGVNLVIDSATGQIILKNKDSDIEKLLKAKEFLKAIEYGFSPITAQKLLSDEQNLRIIDLTDHVKSDKDLSRIKGRIIGGKGKTRQIIEETSDVSLSIYRSYISLIGTYDDIIMAGGALSLLIKGAPHKTVYNRLYNERTKRKMEKRVLWL